MSDHYQIVVFPEVTKGNSAGISRKLLGWLWDRRILRREAFLASDEMARLKDLAGQYLPEALPSFDRFAQIQGRGYMPDSGARSVVCDPSTVGDWPTGSENCLAFGLEVVNRAWVHADINLPTASTCPKCGVVVGDRKWFEPPLEAASGQWCKSGRATLACKSCSTATDLREWTFDPPAACGYLALRFGNWPPLARSFVTHLGEIAKSRTVWVEELI